MSQQNLDLKRSIAIVRRHKKLFGGVAMVGLLLGGVAGFFTPPMLTARALVVISQMPSQNGQQSTSGSSNVDSVIATQVVIAGSDPVIAGALPHVRPSMSLEELQNRVTVASVGTSNIISISATGKTAAQAEGICNAVADSYIAFVGASTSSAVQAQVRVVESATTATGTKLPAHIAIFAVVGTLAGAIIGFIIALALGRSDRRLVERDAIANSIAAPVLLSIPADRPADPVSWVRLLDQYDPDPVHAYGLSKLLHQFGVAGHGDTKSGVSLNVLSLSTDPGALALGPQLAAYAAAYGVPTALVVGPQQDMNVTATLRTACAAPPAAGQRKPLRLVVSEDGDLGQLRATFVVVVTVVDGRDPIIPETMRTMITVLGVSAGGATAEQLARAASAAAVDNRDVVGIIVANPDPGDPTTGRIPRMAPMRRSLPTRVNGLASEIRR